MDTLKFKTNAKCGGCVAKIGEQLDKIIEKSQWSIDLAVPEKILTVTADKTADEIISAVKTAGFTAEKL